MWLEITHMPKAEKKVNCGCTVNIYFISFDGISFTKEVKTQRKEATAPASGYKVILFLLTSSLIC